MATETRGSWCLCSRIWSYGFFSPTIGGVVVRVDASALACDILSIVMRFLGGNGTWCYLRREIWQTVDSSEAIEYGYRLTVWFSLLMSKLSRAEFDSISIVIHMKYIAGAKWLADRMTTLFTILHEVVSVSLWVWYCTRRYNHAKFEIDILLRRSSSPPPYNINAQ